MIETIHTYPHSYDALAFIFNFDAISHVETDLFLSKWFPFDDAV
jgi:hypothetical protein